LEHGKAVLPRQYFNDYFRGRNWDNSPKAQYPDMCERRNPGITWQMYRGDQLANRTKAIQLAENQEQVASTDRRPVAIISPHLSDPNLNLNRPALDEAIEVDPPLSQSAPTPSSREQPIEIDPEEGETLILGGAPLTKIDESTPFQATDHAAKAKQQREDHQEDLDYPPLISDREIPDGEKLPFVSKPPTAGNQSIKRPAPSDQSNRPTGGYKSPLHPGASGAQKPTQTRPSSGRQQFRKPDIPSNGRRSPPRANPRVSQQYPPTRKPIPKSKDKNQHQRVPAATLFESHGAEPFVDPNRYSLLQVDPDPDPAEYERPPPRPASAPMPPKLDYSKPRVYKGQPKKSTVPTPTELQAAQQRLAVMSQEQPQITEAAKTTEQVAEPVPTPILVDVPSPSAPIAHSEGSLSAVPKPSELGAILTIPATPVSTSLPTETRLPVESPLAVQSSNLRRRIHEQLRDAQASVTPESKLWMPDICWRAKVLVANHYCNEDWNIRNPTHVERIPGTELVRVVTSNGWGQLTMGTYQIDLLPTSMCRNPLLAWYVHLDRTCPRYLTQIELDENFRRLPRIDGISAKWPWFFFTDLYRPSIGNRPPVKRSNIQIEHHGCGPLSRVATVIVQQYLYETLYYGKVPSVDEAETILQGGGTLEQISYISIARRPTWWVDPEKEEILSTEIGEETAGEYKSIQAKELQTGMSPGAIRTNTTNELNKATKEQELLGTAAPMQAFYASFTFTPEPQIRPNSQTRPMTRLYSQRLYFDVDRELNPLWKAPPRPNHLQRGTTTDFKLAAFVVGVDFPSGLVTAELEALEHARLQLAWNNDLGTGRQEISAEGTVDDDVNWYWAGPTVSETGETGNFKGDQPQKAYCRGLNAVQLLYIADRFEARIEIFPDGSWRTTDIWLPLYGLTRQKLGYAIFFPIDSTSFPPGGPKWTKVLKDWPCSIPTSAAIESQLDHHLCGLLVLDQETAVHPVHSRQQAFVDRHDPNGGAANRGEIVAVAYLPSCGMPGFASRSTICWFQRLGEKRISHLLITDPTEGICPYSTIFDQCHALLAAYRASNLLQKRRDRKLKQIAIRLFDTQRADRQLMGTFDIPPTAPLTVVQDEILMIEFTASMVQTRARVTGCQMTPTGYAVTVAFTPLSSSMIKAESLGNINRSVTVTVETADVSAFLSEMGRQITTDVPGVGGLRDLFRHPRTLDLVKNMCGYSNTQYNPHSFVKQVPEDLAPFRGQLIGTSHLPALSEPMVKLVYMMTETEAKIPLLTVTGAGGSGKTTVLLATLLQLCRQNIHRSAEQQNRILVLSDSVGASVALHTKFVEIVTKLRTDGDISQDRGRFRALCAQEKGLFDLTHDQNPDPKADDDIDWDRLLRTDPPTGGSSHRATAFQYALEQVEKIDNCMNLELEAVRDHLAASQEVRHSFATIGGRQERTKNRAYRIAFKVSSVDIIFCTPSFLFTPSMRGLKFTQLFINDANRIGTLPGILALCHLDPDRFRKVALFGDLCQLGPSNFAPGAAGILVSQSILAKVIQAIHGLNARIGLFNLDQNFRQRPKMAEILSDVCYGRMVRSSPDAYFAPYEDTARSFPMVHRDRPISVLNCDNPMEINRVGDLGNPNQALFASRLVEWLVHQGIDPSKITLLSFYPHQQWLNQGELNKISTPMWRRNQQGKREEVDPSKKVLNQLVQESAPNDVIILVTTRYIQRGHLLNDGDCLGCLRDQKLVTTALTRAELRLIIIGSVSTLERDPQTWGPLLHRLNRQGRRAIMDVEIYLPSALYYFESRTPFADIYDSTGEMISFRHATRPAALGTPQQTALTRAKQLETLMFRLKQNQTAPFSHYTISEWMFKDRQAVETGPFSHLSTPPAEVVLRMAVRLLNSKIDNGSDSFLDKNNQYPISELDRWTFIWHNLNWIAMLSRGSYTFTSGPGLNIAVKDVWALIREPLFTSAYRTLATPTEKTMQRSPTYPNFITSLKFPILQGYAPIYLTGQAGDHNRIPQNQKLTSRIRYSKQPLALSPLERAIRRLETPSNQRDKLDPQGVQLLNIPPPKWLPTSSPTPSYSLHDVFQHLAQGQYRKIEELSIESVLTADRRHLSRATRRSAAARYYCNIVSPSVASQNAAAMDTASRPPQSTSAPSILAAADSMDAITSDPPTRQSTSTDQASPVETEEEIEAIIMGDLPESDPTEGIRLGESTDEESTEAGAILAREVSTGNKVIVPTPDRTETEIVLEENATGDVEETTVVNIT